jgi:hypothetical protein
MMISRAISWIDRRNFISIRAAVLGVTVWLTVSVIREAWIFAAMSHFDGVGTAAVIAAVTAPVTALQGFAFSSYMGAK